METPQLTLGGAYVKRILSAEKVVKKKEETVVETSAAPGYKALFAHPTRQLEKLTLLRGTNPLYGMFLVGQLGIANREERIQAFESLMEMPRSMVKHVRVPKYEVMPAGPLARERLDPLLLTLGLATAQELGGQAPVNEDEPPPDPRDAERDEFGERIQILTVADKLKRLFDHQYPGVPEVPIVSCWAAGEVLTYEGNFNKYVTSNGLQKQEGVIFRHLLRLILLLGEFRELVPFDCDPFAWQDDLDDISARLTETCRRVDPSSTEKALEEAKP